MPLFYVGPGQVNAQIPWDAPPGRSQLAVTKGVPPSGSVTSVPVFIMDASPSVFTYSENLCIVVNPDQSLNGPGRGAGQGGVVVMYLNSAGQVKASGRLETGSGSPDGLSPVTSGYSIVLGGRLAEALYMGLTPRSVGLFQANFSVPAVPAGKQAITVYVGGRRSNTCFVYVN